MSETSGLGTWSPHHIVPRHDRRPVPAWRSALGPIDDGDAVWRGRRGWARGRRRRGSSKVRSWSAALCVWAVTSTDARRTADALDGDGWLHTAMSAGSTPTATCRSSTRIKDIIVPSSGQQREPGPARARLKECPLVGQACGGRDGRPHVAALVVPDPEGGPDLGRRHDLAGADPGRRTAGRSAAG